jgi:DNA-binding transcriptional regulator YiaG
MSPISRLPGNAEIADLENADKTAGARAHARFIGRNFVPPSFCAPSRLKLTARVLPGRMETMIHLAWLSRDKRAHKVAAQWNALSAESKERTRIEELCRRAYISDAEFFREVARTVWELHIPAGTLGSNEPRWSLPDALEQAITIGDPFGSGFKLCLTAAEHVQRRDQMLAIWERKACDEMTRMRRKWRLSQAQMARLFMVDVRAIRRWETHEITPTRRHQLFLALLVNYVEANGLNAFRRRFVRQAPRYKRVGRPRRALV